MSAAHLHVLRERLLALLAPLPPYLRADVERALKSQGKLLSSPLNELSSTHVGVWPKLTLQVALMIFPDVDLHYASAVALSMECFVCALDLLDDVEDNDRTPIIEEMNIPRVLNVSTALLALVQKALDPLTNNLTLLSRIQRAIRDALLKATGGQHLDLLAEQQSFDTLTDEQCIEKCIEIAAGKAGAIMALAFELGALVGGASDPLVQLCVETGRLAGISFQLKNDCHDFSDYITASRDQQEMKLLVKTDVERQKKTLPLVLAHRLLRDTPAADTKEQKAELFSAGFVAAWAIRLLQIDYVREHLAKIEMQRPIPPFLRILLDVEATEPNEEGNCE